MYIMYDQVYIERLRPTTDHINDNFIDSGMGGVAINRKSITLVAWHSGRTSIFGRRTFPVLRLMGDHLCG